jgi:hypothetical protein
MPIKKIVKVNYMEYIIILDYNFAYGGSKNENELTELW